MRKCLIVVWLLILATSGGLGADIERPDLDAVKTIPNVNPEAPLPETGSITIGDYGDEFTKPDILDRTPVPPTTLWPPEYFCDYTDYSHGVYEDWFPLPREYLGATIYSVRYTSYEDCACTLKTVHVGLDPTISKHNTGTADMVVMIADYDRTVRGSVTVPHDALPAAVGYASVDISAIDNGNPLVYSFGEAFFIYVTVSDPDNDTLVITSAYGPTSSFMFWSETLQSWYWFGQIHSPNLNIGLEICCGDIPYSDCYRQDYECVNTDFRLYSTPAPDGVTDFNMRFSVEGPCTLKAVGIAFFDDSPAMGSPGMNLLITGSVGGFPDLSDVKYQTALSFAELVLSGPEYPPMYNHISLPEDIIVREDFHIVINADLNLDPNAYLLIMADDGFCPQSRASAYYNDSWHLLNDLYADGDANLMIYADLCRDEFATCLISRDYCDPFYQVGLSNQSGSRTGVYQRFQSVAMGCRLEKIRIALDPPDIDAGDPATMYSYDAVITVREDFAGQPGSVIGTPVAVTPGDYVYRPGWLEIDITDQNLLYDGPIYVGLESAAPNLDYGMWVVADDGNCGAAAAWWHYPAGDSPDNTEWFTPASYGPGYDLNHLIEIDICYIPAGPPACGSAEDWPTAGHDFRRTSASFNSTGDARCKQDLLWYYPGPGAGIIYSRPVIYDDILVVSYDDRLQAFDIDGNGAGGGRILWTIKGMPSIGGYMRNSVTVKDGYVYFGGGNAQSINRADVYTGSDVDMDGFGLDVDVSGVPLDPQAWTRNILNGKGLLGNTIYTTSVILDIDGTDVLFVGSDAGDLWALHAATGEEYTLDSPNPGDPGWVVNPLILDGNVWATLSSNGTDMLFVGTDGTNDDGHGTLYSIEATTGNILWADSWPKMGTSWPDETLEIFQGPIAYDYGDNTLYLRSSFDYQTETPGGPSGIRYKIDALTGEIIWSSGGRSYWHPSSASVSGPVIGPNMVYFTAVPSWTDESRQTAAVSKNNGTIIWESDAAFDGAGFVEGALDCRPLKPALLYLGNTAGQFLAINSADGQVEFEYHYPPGTSANGCGVAIDSTHLVMTNRNGNIFCFTEQEDRPRLRVLKFDEYRIVQFFSPEHHIIEFKDVFMNNGCAPLTGRIEAHQPSPELRVTSVRPDRIDRLTDLADRMIANSYPSMAKYATLDMRGYDNFEESAYARESYSDLSAYAPPVWLNEIVIPDFDLSEGETFDVIFDVNGPMVNRGTYQCYVQIIPENEQYILGGGGNPIVQLGVIGGCLESHEELYFGVDYQNLAPVANTGSLGNQGMPLFEIDGVNDALWQGGFVIATAQHEIAFNLDSWHNDYPDDYWNTLVPDVNCMGQCEPIVEGPVVLGQMWNGTAYDPVEGFYSTSRYIDSVIDYDCDGTGWDWDNTHCPYDNNLTMGLMIDQYVYGAVEQPHLNNVVVYRLDITNRNADSLPGVYFGALIDWDILIDQSNLFLFEPDHSISWTASCLFFEADETDRVYGLGKIPMRSDPMLGVRTLDAQHAMWHEDNVALDSMYHWMSEVPGCTWQDTIIFTLPCEDDSYDREAWYSLTSHDFGPNESYSFGIYLFGFEEVYTLDTSFFAEFAIRVNQWAGFCRGDINGDLRINLADVVAIFNLVVRDGPGPLYPHLADIDGTPGVNLGDVVRLADYWWGDGRLEEGWALPVPCE